MDIEFSIDKQELLIQYMLSETTIFQRSRNILKASYFDKELQEVVAFILSHAEKFNATPTVEQIKAETGITLSKINKVKEQDVDYALTNLEAFCQRSAVVEAVQAAPEFIDEGNRGKVLELVKAAMEVGLQKDLGTAYFEDPRERLERMKIKSLVPTGWYDIDRKLYGGLNRGELTIFTAGSGMGKSLFLQNLCLNWIEGAKKKNYDDTEEIWKPLNVVYITLELSEELTAKRIDSMITGIDARDIFKRIDDVELKVKMKSKKSAHLQLKYMPAGSTCNDIIAYLKEYEIQNGKRIDALVVDYLDLLHPNAKKINVSDLFIKDKFVTEELRSMAADMDILCVTASQLNRSAVDESEHNQAMIAGGISKIQTADNVLSIYASPSMKQRGEYMVQFLKTRSSSGVGSKVYVGFDYISLRISNLDEVRKGEIEANTIVAGPGKITVKGQPGIVSNSKSNNAIMDHIKRGPESKTVEIDEEPKESNIERLQKFQEKGLL